MSPRVNYAVLIMCPKHRSSSLHCKIPCPPETRDEFDQAKNICPVNLCSCQILPRTDGHFLWGFFCAVYCWIPLACRRFNSHGGWVLMCAAPSKPTAARFLYLPKRIMRTFLQIASSIRQRLARIAWSRSPLGYLHQQTRAMSCSHASHRL